MNQSETPSRKDEGNQEQSTKWSRSASIIFNAKIRNISDPNGEREAEINRIAKSMARAQHAGNDARYRSLRLRLVEKCMRFFFVVGQNVSTFDDNGTHFGGFVQINDLFLQVLQEQIEHYRFESTTPFTHSLRARFKSRRSDAARKQTREDEAFGGGEGREPIRLEDTVRKNDDGSTTLENYIGEEEDFSHLYNDPSWEEEDARQALTTEEAIEESGSQAENSSAEQRAAQSEIAEDKLLVEILSLIVGFYESTGRKSNEERKQYTRMFFSETLTKTTKLRGEGELAPLIRHEKSLFDSVELPFQDYYTLSRCRTIRELWDVGFIDGIKEVRTPNDDPDSPFVTPNFKWRIPAKVYIAYMNTQGKSVSDAAISYQRSHYEKLLSALDPREKKTNQ